MFVASSHPRDVPDEHAVPLEQQGWSLPIYRETILADAAKTEF